MMNVEDAPVNYDVSKRRVKKALPFDDNGKIKLTRRPLGGRNIVHEDVLAAKVATKSTFDFCKTHKDDVDAKIALKKATGKLLYKKRKPADVFSVPLPKIIPVTIQDVSEDLCELSISIDSILAAVPEGVTKVDFLGGCSFNNPAYAQDIINYNLERERKFALSPDFLNASRIKPHSRGVLVDWLIQVQTHTDIQTDSLHIAICLLDHMLSKRPISLNKLQLIGVVCLFIACKMNERFPPEIKELLRLTENAYSRTELMAIERLVIKSLDFDLYRPTPLVFIDRCVQACQEELGVQTKEVKIMAIYLLQLGLTDARFSAILPSKRAAAAFWLARKLLLPASVETWNRSLSWYTTYSENEILPVFSMVAKMCVKAPEARFQGARTKYSSKSRYGCISHHQSLEDDVVRTIAYAQ